MGLERKLPYTVGAFESAKSAIQHGGERGRGLDGRKGYFQTFSLSAADLENKRVLDLGSGPELRFASELKALGSSADVVSLTPGFASESVRAGARKSAHPEAVAQAVAGMGEHLPFGNGAFDVVVSLQTIQFLQSDIPRKMLFLKEVARVLAPGGSAYIGPTYELTSKQQQEIIDAAHGQVSFEWPNIPGGTDVVMKICKLA